MKNDFNMYVREVNYKNINWINYVKLKPSGTVVAITIISFRVLQQMGVVERKEKPVCHEIDGYELIGIILC